MRRLSIWVIGFIWIGTAGFAVSGLGQYTQVTEKFLPGDAVRIQVWQLWESKPDREVFARGCCPNSSLATLGIET